MGTVVWKSWEPLAPGTHTHSPAFLWTCSELGTGQECRTPSLGHRHVRLLWSEGGAGEPGEMLSLRGSRRCWARASHPSRKDQEPIALEAQCSLRTPRGSQGKHPPRTQPYQVQAGNPAVRPAEVPALWRRLPAAVARAGRGDGGQHRRGLQSRLSERPLRAVAQSPNNAGAVGPVSRRQGSQGRGLTQELRSGTSEGHHGQGSSLSDQGTEERRTERELSGEVTVGPSRPVEDRLSQSRLSRASRVVFSDQRSASCHGSDYLKHI